MLDKKITDDLERFAKEIMDNEGVTEYELNIEGQTEKGVNYGSEIVFFSVTAEGGKIYRFVMKTTRRSEAMRKAIQDGVGDRREMHMYCKVFPALRQMLSQSKSQYQLENIPRTFLVNTEYQHETAIMQDLRSLGYKLWDTKKPMNMEHLRAVLENYGKFHAASMALSVKNPQLFKELTQDMDSIFKYFVRSEGFTKMFKSYVDDALSILKQVGLHEIAKKVENYPEKVPEILSMTVDEKDRVVVTHGDCWNNNIMFKYEGSEKVQPSEVCFLDFQCSLFGSPAVDLSYFLYTSVDAENLLKGVEPFLRVYYESLAATLKSLELEVEELFTYQELQEHWKKYSIFGLLLASAVIKIQLTNRENAPDIKEVEKGESWSALKVDKVEDVEEYRERIAAVYKHHVKTCLN